ncbi:hypothetical protein [Cytobacillus firmus]|uniref:hypothetical protein n=1 Tax=Cytobacillus firmus TaxID=1399 RepID=UPI001CFE7F66|nr:hypothetical protein [Cytobacillus firmus]
MENIKHKDLLNMLSNLQFPSSEDFNKLFLLTKKEGLVRDFLIVEIERKLRETQVEFDYLAYPEWKDHDCVLLKKENDNTYIPTSLIELKYAKSPFILGRKDVRLNETARSHDSIWLENYTLKKEIDGKVSGVKKDLVKMLSTSEYIQSYGYSKPSIHQVIIITMTKSQINKKLYSYIQPKFRKNADSFVIQNDFVNFKKQLDMYQNNNDQHITDIKGIIETQFEIIHQQYFAEHQIETGFTSLPIGKAYGTEMELYFFVMSIE